MHAAPWTRLYVYNMLLDMLLLAEGTTHSGAMYVDGVWYRR